MPREYVLSPELYASHEEELTASHSNALKERFTVPIAREQPAIEKIRENTGVHFLVPGADPNLISYTDSDGERVYQLNITTDLPPNRKTSTTFLPGGQVLRPSSADSPHDVVVAFTAPSIEGLPFAPPKVIFEMNEKNACRDSKGRMYRHAMWAAEIKQEPDGTYMYTTAETEPFPQGNAMHRSVVYKGNSPRGPFSPVGFLGDDKWGIDFSPDGQYGFWSGWESGEDGCQVIKAGRMDGPAKMAEGKRSIIVPSLHPGDMSRQFGIAVNEGPEPYYDQDGNYKALLWSKGLSWVGIGADAYNQWVYPFYGEQGDDMINPACYRNAYPLFDKPLGFGHGQCFAQEQAYVGHQFYPGSALYHWSTRWAVKTPITIDSNGLPHGNIKMEAFLSYRSKCLPTARH